MFNLTPSKPIISFDKTTCQLSIRGNSYASDVQDLFNLLLKDLDTTCCRKLTLEIDLEFFTVGTIKSLKSLFLFSKNNFKDVEVDWLFDEDCEDIDVLEKICKIKINKIQREIC